MATKSIQVRLDKNLKKRVEKILAGIGVDVPTAVRIFFVKVVASGGIPFLLQAGEEDRYRAKQMDAFDRLAVRATKEKLVGPFTTIEDLLESLHR